MKNILKIAAFSTLLLGTAQAASTQEQIKVIDYNTFYDTQVNNVDCGGYWDERRVWVCDYRTELVDVSYKTCHYKLIAGEPYGPYTLWQTKTVLATQSCPEVGLFLIQSQTIRCLEVPMFINMILFQLNKKNAE